MRLFKPRRHPHDFDGEALVTNSPPQSASTGRIVPIAVATMYASGELASTRLAVLNMPPMAFCKDALAELSMMSSNDGWVRGAHAMCEMYAGTDAKRFDLILRRLSQGTTGLALTEGARWLLGRWQSVQAGQL